MFEPLFVALEIGVVACFLALLHVLLRASWWLTRRPCYYCHSHSTVAECACEDRVWYHCETCDGHWPVRLRP